MHVFTHLTKSEHLQKSAFRGRLWKLWDRLFCLVVFISELSLLWAKCWTRWSPETPPTCIKLWAMIWVSLATEPPSIGSKQQQAFVGKKVYFSTAKAWNKHFVYCAMVLLYLLSNVSFSEGGAFFYDLNRPSLLMLSYLLIHLTALSWLSRYYSWWQNPGQDQLLGRQWRMNTDRTHWSLQHQLTGWVQPISNTH